MSMVESVRTCLALAAALAVAACGREPVPPDPPAPLEVILSQESVEVIAGTRPGCIRPCFDGPTARLTYRLTSADYAGAVTVAHEVPSGWSSNGPHHLQLLGGDTLEAVIEIAIPGDVPDGDYDVIIEATPFIGRETTDTIHVSVAAFAMQLAARSITVNQGAQGYVSVFVAGGGAGNVHLEVGNVPAGVSVTPVMGPVPQPGVGGWRLELTASATAAAQTTSLLVTGSSGGTELSQTLDLIVQPPQPTRPISFTLCTGYDAFFGRSYGYANDGAGWQSMTPGSDGYFTIDATERVRILERATFRGGYALSRRTRVIHATASELEQLVCPTSVTGSKSLTLDATTDWAFTGSVGGQGFATANGTRLAFGAGLDGPVDLVATGLRSTVSGTERKAIVRRGVDLPNATTVSLDFGSAEAVILDSANYSAPGAASAMVSIHTPTTVGGDVSEYPPEFFRTQNAQIRATTPAQGSGRYWGLPAPLLGEDDLQSLNIQTGGLQTRGIVHYFREVADRQLTFGPVLNAPTVDSATQTISLASQPQYPDIAGAGFLHLIDFRGDVEYVESWVTRGYVGATPTTWLFPLPDPAPLASPVLISGEPGAMAASGPSMLMFGGGNPTSGTELLWASINRFGRALPYPRAR